MALFDEAARKRIEDTIAEIEQRTAAELVVVSVQRSDSYPEARLASALFCALLSGVIGHTFWPQLHVVEILWLEEAAALFGFLVSGVPWLLRSITSRRRAHGMVERRAREAFVEHSVFATRDRTGVLILISELERRVVILGDKAIHERVQASGWQGHVQRIIDGIHSGRAADGVCDVLQTIGEVLRAEFPAKTDDTNELPNRVTQTDA
jgi:putative membrane protein